jgi:phosphatidylserine decarboxylase
VRALLAKGTPAFIAVPPVVVALLLAAIGLQAVPMEWWTILPVVVLAILAVIGIHFFRDPDRHVAEGLVAPAHGRILGVEEEDGRVRVSTFMSPFDVHVVRAPLSGQVASMERSGSGFRRAYEAEADHNVQLELDLQGDREPFTVVMVSGWLARRIVPYVSVGDRVERGSRIGLIRFGSRVDVIVPKGVFDIKVERDSQVRAGASSLGVRADADS